MEKPRLRFSGNECISCKNMKIVSVIIPNLNEPEDFLQKTIQSLNDTADGPIEIIIEEDSGSEGMRKVWNRGVGKAKGGYLFFLDGHCSLTPHWDTLLKKSCGQKDIVFSMIQAIDPKTWEYTAGIYGSCTLDSDLVEKWGKREVLGTLEESMTFTGCGWMIRRKRFLELGGFDEDLGRYGSIGPEFSLKVWLSGGKVLIHKDVRCGHVFRLKPIHLIPNQEVQEGYQKLRAKVSSYQLPLQIYSLGWLFARFSSFGGQLRREQKVTTTKVTQYRAKPGNINLLDYNTVVFASNYSEASIQSVQILETTR